ncbi:hypothetical protein C5S36_03845 [Candidatus Methanophagaceae archaeon]|nr:hypothetical protein C5S36_03845 [Methanophagales archaeon]
MEKIMSNKLVLLILILLFAVAYSWGYNERLGLPNENVVFSFVSEDEKVISVCVAEDESYLVYRFGTPDKIELQFPSDSELVYSWELFSFEYYFRGGGDKNEGLDINYLYFTFDDLSYEVYHEYYSVDNITSIGARITDVNTDYEYHLVGNPETIKGNLSNLRIYNFHN